MGRQPQPAIAQRLLDQCVDYALEHGLPNKLQPLVQATGTSARMLLYHFGTRDDLLRATLRRARERHREAFGDLLRARTDEPYATTLAHAWTAMSGVEGQPYLRIFGPLRTDTEQQLWPDFKREATTDWLRPLEEGLASIGRPELATLLLAVMRGLLMDLEATADIKRADLAFRQFLDTLGAPVAPTP